MPEPAMPNDVLLQGRVFVLPYVPGLRGEVLLRLPKADRRLRRALSRMLREGVEVEGHSVFEEVPVECVRGVP